MFSAEPVLYPYHLSFWYADLLLTKLKVH